MKKINQIGLLLKKIYRIYSNDLLLELQQKGFTDLRPSFLEVLLFIAENEGSTIKDIGQACGLKKQTMTSHLNELEKRDYIIRQSGEKDKREQHVSLTEYGQKFRFSLFESVNEIEKKYSQKIGDVELDRVLYSLQSFYDKMS